MQERSAHTRGQILDAALRVFAQQGYQASGVAEICAAAGVSKGAFYHHFPSKLALFLELLQRWLSQLDAGMESAQSQTGSVPEALELMSQLMEGVFQSAGDYLPVFLEFWTQASHDPDIWQAVIAPYHRYQKYFADLVRTGIQEGSFRPVDADLAARTIVAQAVGTLIQGVLDPGSTDWGQVTRQGLAWLIESMSIEVR